MDSDSIGACGRMAAVCRHGRACSWSHFMVSSAPDKRVAQVLTPYQTSTQVPVPRMVGLKGEAGASPALSRNCKDVCPTQCDVVKKTYSCEGEIGGCLWQNAAVSFFGSPFRRRRKGEPKAKSLSYISLVSTEDSVGRDGV